MIQTNNNKNKSKEIINNSLNTEVHITSLKGSRKQNEDKHSTILNIDENNSNLAKVNLYGVYDGHGGKFVSTYLQNKLPQWFMSKNVEYPLTKQYVNTVYKYIQDDLIQNYHNESTHYGSTCLLVIQFKNNDDDYLNIMNTGDTRCVLCRDFNAMPLTKDHKPMWPEERRRITALGGLIIYDGHDYRIKDLSVSRAFGDIDANPYVTNMPDIYRYRIEKNDYFIIIACDGLWDVLSNSDAVNFVLNNCYDETFNRINKSVNIARKLGEYALKKGSTDNISIIVVFFK